MNFQFQLQRQRQPPRANRKNRRHRQKRAGRASGRVRRQALVHTPHGLGCSGCGFTAGGRCLVVVCAQGGQCRTQLQHTSRHTRQLDLDSQGQWDVQPSRSISIGSELSGTVLKVNVDVDIDVDDSIKKGWVLVVLDTAKLRDQILRSAALAAADAKVAQTAATIPEVTTSLSWLEEVARISGGKVPLKTELDTSRAKLDRAIADDISAKAGVNDARAALSTDVFLNPHEAP